MPLHTPIIEKRNYHPLAFTDERHHLNHPIPLQLKIQPIGKTLTEQEWHKFCERLLSPKLEENCYRQNDGDIFFIGESGMEAAEIFQHKYNNHYRMRLICDKKSHAAEGLQMAEDMGLKIQEVFFKQGSGKYAKLNDESIIRDEFMIH